jgi:outer membrane protein TolC
MRMMVSLRFSAPLAALWAALLAAPCQAAQSGDLALADAVRLALAQNPAIQVQQAQIEVAAGQRQQASGQFDWQLTAAANYDRTLTPLTDGAITANGAPFLDQTRLISAGYQLGLNKQLRNGLQLGSTLSAVSTDDNTPGALRGQQNLVRLDVALTVPLLRGRGAASVAANEEAARLNEQAEQYLLRQRAAETVFATLQAYWTYRARIDLEQVAQSAETRSASLLDSVRKLVEAAERPRADLVLLQADLADKQAAHQAAVLARNDARVALGRLLGLDPGAIAALAAPAQTLPASALAGGPGLGQAEARPTPRCGSGPTCARWRCSWKRPSA